MLLLFIKRFDYLYSNIATMHTTQLLFALRDLLQSSQANQPESKLQRSWRKSKEGRGLLESVAGEFDGAAPAGTACAAAGSSPGLFHQSAPRTSSAAARTPEGKAVNTDGMQPGPRRAVMSADADLPPGLTGRRSHIEEQCP